MEKMVVSNNHPEDLIALGLSGSQAKVYLALLKNGTSSVREVAKTASISRPDTYRSIISLEELGIVERIITNPTKFKPLPLKETLSILVSQKEKQFSDLRKKADEF